MASFQESDQLKVERSNGRLIISISEDLLIHSCLMSDYAQEHEEQPTLTDKNVFIEAMVRQLEMEDEEGTTVIHRAFDEAFQDAAEFDDIGVDFHD